MSLIKSFLGRRQFLVAAGAASVSALAFKRLAGIIDPDFQTRVATASEKSGTALIKGANHRYSHLLSPLKLGNVVLKNRMLYTISTPHFLQGPENFPSDVNRAYYANVAKGAAIVDVRIIQNRVRKDLGGDSAHMLIYDLEDYGVQNYLDQMVEGIHCYGSLASVSIRVSAGGPSMPMAAPGEGAPGAERGTGAPQVQVSAENTQQMIENAVTQARFFQAHGFDMVYLGGNGFQEEASARSTIEMMQAVKKACGPDFLIGMGMELKEPSLGSETSGSNVRTLSTLEKEAVAMAKMFEGTLDILLFKVGAKYTSFDMEKGKPVVLRIGQAMKESGAKIVLCANGGLRDPDLNEEAIASGKTDMIGMARAFICDPEYGKKVYEGRGEDTVPCIMCNKCHGLSFDGPWFSVCSVNPKIGIESVLRTIDVPTAKKKVAVIGGGPAGMKAAITASERGHKVTLYEKNASLGGLLRHSDFSSFKWALKDFKDYLIRQMDKARVEVVSGTQATPDMIRTKGYDAVLVALGSETVISKIPGADGGNIWNVVNVYGREKELGKDVVIVGGGRFGAETGMYLANAGHKVTVLTMDKELMERGGPHQSFDTYEYMDNFSYILQATTTRISGGKIIYKDVAGNEKSIQADSVVVYAGLSPRQDEAMKFSGSANQVLLLGDCTGKGGSVQRVIRSAFFIASQV